MVARGDDDDGDVDDNDDDDDDDDNDDDEGDDDEYDDDDYYGDDDIWYQQSRQIPISLIPDLTSGLREGLVNARQ